VDEAKEDQQSDLWHLDEADFVDSAATEVKEQEHPPADDQPNVEPPESEHLTTD